MRRGEGFLDPEAYAWTRELRRHWRTVRRELDDLLDRSPAGGTDWNPVHRNLLEPHPEAAPWSSWTLRYFTIVDHAACNACPRTAELLEGVPELLTASFSALRPGTEIRPHRGITALALRSHLGLRIPQPDRCALQVGDRTRHLREGEVLVFNDRAEHRAWNRGDRTRVVLLLDLVRPGSGLTAAELSRMFLRTTSDPEVLRQAGRCDWLRWQEAGAFPVGFSPFTRRRWTSRAGVGVAP